MSSSQRIRNLPIIISFLALFLLNLSESVDNNESEKPLIDYLTLDYLSVEQNLWRKLVYDQNTDKSTLFSLIRNEHKRFFSIYFGSTVDLQGYFVYYGNQYILPSTKPFLNNLMLTRVFFDNSSLLLESEHLDDIIRTVDHSSLNFAQELSADLFREVSRAEFWEKGKNVSGQFALIKWWIENN